MTEGSSYRDEAGMQVKKRLKPDAVPTIFPLAIHGGGSGRSKTSPLRLAAQKRQRQAVSKNKLASYLAINYTSFIKCQYIHACR